MMHLYLQYNTIKLFFLTQKKCRREEELCFVILEPCLKAAPGYEGVMFPDAKIRAKYSLKMTDVCKAYYCEHGKTEGDLSLLPFELQHHYQERFHQRGGTSNRMMRAAPLHLNNIIIQDLPVC